MLIWILLGVIGLAAYVWWRAEPNESPQIMPQPPEQTHRHYHYP
jgi:hypothetical protein